MLSSSGRDATLQEINMDQAQVCPSLIPSAIPHEAFTDFRIQILPFPSFTCNA